jgi:galactokinase
VSPAQALLQRFEQLTGQTAQGIWTAPGRVNLIGEHTDYNNGFVLPIAIDRRITIAAAPTDDPCIKGFSIHANDGFQYDLESLAPGTLQGWAAYPCGAAWALKTMGVEVRGSDLVIDSTIPAGAGLASSAALTTAAALALSELSARPLSGAELAGASHRAEVEFVGVPCGVMDQMISALGRTGAALFVDTQTSGFQYVSLDLPSAGLALAVIDTRVAHRLSESRYAERRRECEEAAQALGLGSLRQLTLADLPDALDQLSEPHKSRVRHVVTENARVLEAVEAITGRQFTEVGTVFVQSHESLKTDFQVSCPELDAAVEAAVGAGALGARMTGAGFGGSAIAIIGNDQLGTMSQSICAAFERQKSMEPAILEVAPSAGATRVDP